MDNTGPLSDDDDNSLSDNKGMLSVLNQTLNKIFTKEKTRIPHRLKIFQGSEEMLFINENEAHEVYVNVNKKIDPGKSADPDDISPQIAVYS